MKKPALKKSVSGIKTHTIYKRDKWNMLTVEVNGKQLIAREISQEWGEDCHIFLSRPELMHWANERFKREFWPGTDEEYEAMMEAFKNV